MKMRLVQRFSLVLIPVALAGCGGGSSGVSGTPDEQSDAGLIELRTTLFTGENEDVFDAFWNCEDESDEPGFLLSLWSGNTTTEDDQRLDGASVVKSVDADPHAVEWFPVASDTIELTSTNLVQAGSDQTYQYTNIMFSDNSATFTATDTRGTDVECNYFESGAAAYCQFWGNFKPVCGV